MAYTWTNGELITAEKLNQTGGGEWVDLVDTITIPEGYTNGLYLKEKDGLVAVSGFLVPPAGEIDLSKSLSYSITVTGMPKPLKPAKGGVITPPSDTVPEYYTNISITGSGKATITIKASELAPTATGSLAAVYIPTLAYLKK